MMTTVRTEAAAVNGRFNPSFSTSEPARLQPLRRQANPDKVNLVLLYEDDETNDWTGEIVAQARALIGPASVQATWWKISDLVVPGVLAGAISKAMRADMIVVATRQGEGLPLPFYVWVEQWLPHHRQTDAALVLQTGAPNGPGIPSRLAEYLEAVAKEGKMNFFQESRTPAGQYRVPDMALRAA
jgi:hypothetical protein